METEVVADDAAVADDPAGAGATEAAAAAAGEGAGGRTYGPEAAGAPGATQTAEPSAAAAAAPSSDEPEPSAYLKAGDAIFIQLPWASMSRAPVEGEVFDGEVLASAGLKLVDAPSSSSEPEEERLLRTLLALYRARQAKLESREALAAKAGADLEKRAEELRAINQAALRSLAEEREQLAEAHQAFILEKAEAEEQQRLAAEELSRREGELTQRKVDLDSHEDELAARE